MPIDRSRGAVFESDRSAIGFTIALGERASPSRLAVSRPRIIEGPQAKRRDARALGTDGRVRGWKRPRARG